MKLSRELANLSFSNPGPKAIMPNMNPDTPYVVGGGMAASALCAKCAECKEAATHFCSHELCKAFSSPPGAPFYLCTTCADGHNKRQHTKSHNVVALGASLPSSTNTPQTAQHPSMREGGSARQGGSAARHQLDQVKQLANGGGSSRSEQPAAVLRSRNGKEVESDDDADADSSRAAAGHTLPPAQGSRQPNPSRAATSRAGHVVDGPPIQPTLTKEKLDSFLSPNPIWQMANLHVDQADHFPEPPKELHQLHRRMICNMSYWKRDELRTCVMARILMILATEAPKQEAVFGSDQIPQEHGGGPWYEAGSAGLPEFLSNLESESTCQMRHVEMLIKGLTQLSKTTETICQAFFSFFAEGVLPIIMVRNKGGANVGTADMEDAVLQMNREISTIFEKISPIYSHNVEFHRIKNTDFHLTPRCTSSKPPAWLDFHGDGNYELKYPQVLISCTNVNAVKRMTETTKGTSLGSNMRMSLIELLSGYRCSGDQEHANPHVPYIYNWDRYRKGKEFPKAAIALLFDEDDANRSSTGREKTDTLLHAICPKLKNMTEDMRNLANKYQGEAENAVEGASGGEEECSDEEDQDGREEKDFYKQFQLQLRARVARVYAYTATPITVLHEIAGSISQVEIIMTELKPGKNYVGYKTDRSPEKWPWLIKNIEIVELHNRMRREVFPLKAIYGPIVRRYVDPHFKDGDTMPEPFKTDKNGTIRLNKKDEGVVMELLDPDNNARMLQSALWLRQKALKTGEKLKGRMTQFWREDGVNLVRVLRDIHDYKHLYPEGYRNLLYMTNFSKLEKDQILVVEKVLSLDGEHRELVDGLICMEFTHKHVRFSWRVAMHTDGASFVDAKCMLESAKSLMKEYRNDSVGSLFGQNAMMADAEEGQIQTLETPVPNINWGYSVLWKYKQTKRQHDSSFFLKVMVVTGEIGARGVRYKTAKTHNFVLTDMFYAFAVSSDHQVTAHATGVVQAVGRLCTMSADIWNCPTIKLWIPKDCWALTKLWMECIDCLPDLLKIKREKNILTMDELLAQVTQNKELDFPNIEYLRQLLTAPTGQNKRGDAFYARPSHLLSPAKELSKRLAEHPNCVPVERLQLNDGQDEIRAAILEHGVKLAAMDIDDESSVFSDETMQRLSLPPVAPGEKSVAEPESLQRRYVNRSKGKRTETDSSKTRAEVMQMVQSDSDLSVVYNIADDNFREDVGQGCEGDSYATEVVDAKLLEHYGGTAEEFQEQLAQKPGQSDRQINFVVACLQHLVTLKVLQSSSNFRAGRLLKKIRYWLPVYGRDPYLVDDDRLDTQGSAAKRGRPQGETIYLHN